MWKNRLNRILNIIMGSVVGYSSDMGYTLFGIIKHIRAVCNAVRALVHRYIDLGSICRSRIAFRNDPEADYSEVGG